MSKKYLQAATCRVTLFGCDGFDLQSVNESLNKLSENVRTASWSFSNIKSTVVDKDNGRAPRCVSFYATYTAKGANRNDIETKIAEYVSADILVVDDSASISRIAGV